MPDRVTDSDDVTDLDQLRRVVLPFGLLIAGLTLAGLTAAVVVCVTGANPPTSANMLLLACGCLSAGAFLGFVYGTFGEDETARFGPVFTAVAAAAGGAVALDLTRPDSGLARAADALGVRCGFGPGSGMLVLCVAAAFAPPGFMLLFVYKALLINLRVSTVNSLIRKLDLSRDALRRGGDPLPRSDPNTGGTKPPPPPDPGAAAAAAVIVERTGAGRTGTFNELRSDAQAFAAVGQLPRAAEALRNALAQKPDDARTKYDLGRVLIELGSDENRVAAIPLLQDVVALPEAPADAWKLLGHAGLWGDVPQLVRAAEASEKYFALHSDDFGALLNLACAYGQLAGKAPADQRTGFRDKAIQSLRLLLKDRPSYKVNVAALANDDFVALRDDADFKALVA